jgi:hypothetical protein
VAIKIIDIESAEDEVEDIIQEIAILSELQSPYVTKYYGSYAKGAELWIVMEFCSGGSCADLMKPGLIGEDYIAIIVRELLLGLDYLHSDKKLHRDVKGMLPGRVEREGNANLRDSCQCLAIGRWTSQTCRLWSVWSIVGDHDQEEHIRRHALLDGARGDKTERLRPQGGHMVARNHGP